MLSLVMDHSFTIREMCNEEESIFQSLVLLLSKAFYTGKHENRSHNTYYHGIWMLINKRVIETWKNCDNLDKKLWKPGQKLWQPGQNLWQPGHKLWQSRQKPRHPGKNVSTWKNRNNLDRQKPWQPGQKPWKPEKTMTTWKNPDNLDNNRDNHFSVYNFPGENYVLKNS